MDKVIQEIAFQNKHLVKSSFDLVNYQDLLAKKPTDHSQFEYHRLSFFAIIFFTKGEGMYNTGFTDYSFSPGTIFTLRRNSVHKFFRNDANGYVFVFTEQFLSQEIDSYVASKIYLLFNELLSSPKIQLNKESFEELVTLTKLLKTERNNRNDTHSKYIERNLIMAFLTKLIRIKQADNSYIENNKQLPKFLEFQELVEKHCFTNRKVKFYAEQMFTTTKTLNKITQSIVNKTAKTFVTDILIAKTKTLIVNSNKSLTEISYLVGFDEPSNFFKFFTMYAGTTPTEFKATH